MRHVFVFLAAFLTATPAFAETIRIGVDGMVCAFCVKAIEHNFGTQAAVEKVAVDLDARQVVLTTKSNATLDDAKIKQLVTDSGYDLTGITRQK